ncbi:unnamed protein product, partial [Ectocarpus sp. 12 AP-2014]
MSPSLFVIKQTWNARRALLTGASTPRPASSSRRTASPSTLGWPARDDVGKRCRDYKSADPTMLDTDQLIAKSTQPFHVGCAVKHRRELED